MAHVDMHSKSHWYLDSTHTSHSNGWLGVTVPTVLIVKLRPKADARHDKNRWVHLQREFLCFIGVG